uniref:Uncharacterized protein n=1 Tax=Cacopsylla melanoneura TaxID=428564 RepID=A0A8D9A063_9HEMI
MRCYYEAEVQNIKSEKNVFDIWRRRNPNVRPNMTSTTLSSQRRFIMNKNKLTNDELENIKRSVYEEHENLPDDNHYQIQNDPEVVSDEREVTNVHEYNYLNDDTIEVVQVTEEIQSYRIEVQSTMEEEFLHELNSVMNISFDERVRLPKVLESHKLNSYITDCNAVIKKHIDNNPSLDLTRINHLIFAGAMVVTKKFKKVSIEKTSNVKKQNIPKWQKRIQDKICEWRKEVSILYESKLSQVSDKVKYKAYKIKKRYHIFDRVQLDEILKQKINAYTQRINRYKKRNETYRQNKMFNEDKKRFYQMLLNKNVTIQNPPSAQTAQEFWSNLWSVPSVINHEADWMERESERFENTEGMMEFNITNEDLIEAIQNTQNWKAPGWDSIQNLDRIPKIYEFNSKQRHRDGSQHCLHYALVLCMFFGD